MNRTKIEWTDSTWNPIRGCSRVSKGCEHCYAERVAYRFSGPGQPYEGLATWINGHPAWTGKVALVEEHLLDPLSDPTMKKPVTEISVTCPDGVDITHKRQRPRRIFVNSMSDLFHEAVPDEWIDRIFAVMALCPQNTFQVLTKRPERMLSWASSDDRIVAISDALIDSNIADDPKADRLICKGMDAITRFNEQRRYREMNWLWPLPNVWLGVSVENQAAADERIPLLLQTSAAVRFISAEPLLGAIDLLWDDGWGGKGEPPMTDREPTEEQISGPKGSHFIRHGASRLDWVIVGGESGPGARPMHPDWARGLRDQCVAAGVPFFMKQMGSIYGPHKGHNIPIDLDIKEFPYATR